MEAKVIKMSRYEIVTCFNIFSTVLQMDLPYGAPPILMELKSQVQNYLENPEMLPIHDLEMVQQYWKHETDVHQLCKAEIAPTPTTLVMKRNIKGEIAQIVEVTTPHAGMTNKTSMSLQRNPGNYLFIQRII